MRAALRDALADALAHRDRARMTLYRTALAALDNAEAVPLADEHRAGAVESSPVGVGRGELPRRALTREAEIDIVRQEVHDLRAAADALADPRPDAARRLRSDADHLQAIIDALPADR